MPKKNKKLEWDVVDGKAVRTVPAIPAVAAQSTEIPVPKLDQMLARATKQKERAEARLAEAQEIYDDALEGETTLAALRAQLPA